MKYEYTYTYTVVDGDKEYDFNGAVYKTDIDAAKDFAKETLCNEYAWLLNKPVWDGDYLRSSVQLDGRVIKLGAIRQIETPITQKVFTTGKQKQD